MKIDTNVFNDQEPNGRRGDLDRYLDARVQEINRKDVADWSAIDSLEAWEAFKQPRLAALERSLGVFPDPPDEVRCQATGVIEGDNYLVDKLVFESRPGIAVTANVYRPAGVSNGVGILLIHSHHNPRTQPELQDMGAMWARAGCVVLVMDQLGYGERREHPAGPRHDYWNRYNTGIQLQLIGDSLMGWMVWDNRRGIDVLQQRYGASRIVVMGSVAGGGDPCAVVAALDDRVEVAIPFNFGGPQPETIHPLPENADLAFNYLGTGSWETTRNLMGSGQDGFLPWVIVGAVAPRKLIYAHEFKWDRDNDPVWKRLQQIYSWYDAGECLDVVHGFGEVTGRPPNASHCNNVGPIHRERIHLALERWLGITSVNDREDRREEGLLLCFGVARDASGSSEQDSYLEVIRETGEERTEALRQSIEGLSGADGIEKVREAWRERLGNIEPEVDVEIVGYGEEDDGVRVEKFGLKTDDDITVPAILMGKGRASTVTVMVSASGMAGVMERRREEIDRLLHDRSVCLVDVRGVGALEPEENRTFRSRCAGRAATALMFGETVVGMQLRDLRTVIAHLRSRGFEEIKVEGTVEGPRGESAAGKGRDDPDESDVVARRYVEPIGAVLSYLAGVFEDDVEGGEMPDVTRLLEDTVVDWPYDAVVPGMAVILSPRRIS